MASFQGGAGSRVAKVQLSLEIIGPTTNVQTKKPAFLNTTLKA